MSNETPKKQGPLSSPLDMNNLPRHAVIRSQKSGNLFLLYEKNVYKLDPTGSNPVAHDSWMSVYGALGYGGLMACYAGACARHMGAERVAYAWTGVLNALEQVGNVRPPWNPRRLADWPELAAVAEIVEVLDGKQDL